MEHRKGLHQYSYILEIKLKFQIILITLWIIFVQFMNWIVIPFIIIATVYIVDIISKVEIVSTLRLPSSFLNTKLSLCNWYFSLVIYISKINQSLVSEIDSKEDGDFSLL